MHVENGRMFSHGTLMYDVDQTQIAKALRCRPISWPLRYQVGPKSSHELETVHGAGLSALDD